MLRRNRRLLFNKIKLKYNLKKGERKAISTMNAKINIALTRLTREIYQIKNNVQVSLQSYFQFNYVCTQRKN